MTEEIYGVKITANIKDFQDKMNQVKKIANNIKSVEDRIKDNQIKITGVGFDSNALKKAEDEYEKWRQKQNQKSITANIIPQKAQTVAKDTTVEPQVKENIFVSKLNKLKQLGINVANDIKSAWNNTTVEVDTYEANVRIEELKRELRQLRSEMNNVTPGTQLFREYVIAISSAESELKQLNASLNDTNKKTKSISINSKSLNKLGSYFTRANRGIGRYIAALFTVGSVFAAVSKASNAYLAQDTELANKLQGVWAGLGAFFAPIIEKIANGLIKLVSYLNIFVKAVTGQDLLAKASSKATAKIKDQTKATKSLNKSLTDMDEITNINMDETSGTADQIENPFANFEDVELDTGWADKIKDFGEWVKKNKKAIIGALTGLALAITGLKIAVKGTGALSTFGRILAGIGVTVIGITVAFQGLKDYIDLLDQGLEDTKEGWSAFGTIIAGVGIAILGIGIAVGSLPVAIAGAIVLIIGIITKYWNEIWNFLENAKVKLLEAFQFLFGETLGDIIADPFIQAINLIQSFFNGLLKGVKGILDGIIKMFKGDFKSGLVSVAKGIGNLLIGVLNSLIDGINAMAFPVRALIVALGKVMGKKFTMSNIKIPHIPFLDVGTNYVPEDQLAYIHKGEAVIPKKFNSEQYFSNINNNEETNALLMDVNRNLIALQEKESNFYVNGKELARATYNDYQNEGNRRGSTSVVKVG